MNISAQIGLFEEQESLPVGLHYIPDYIDSDREAVLIKTLDQQPWLTDLKRRVQHYGYRYDYKARGVSTESKLGDIPDWLQSYCEQLQRAGHFPERPDQVIINEYTPGQGIAAHIDCVPCFTDTVISLSLGSACVMDFMHSKTDEKISLLLEPRSLLILSGDARYLWRHAIAPRKTDRYKGQLLSRDRRISLTFRKVILA